MSGYKRAERGDPPLSSNALSARWQNDVTKMLNWFERTKASGEVLPGGNPLESTSGVVKVKNLTSANQLRGNYVQLGDYLLDDVDHHKHWFEGNLYDAAESGRIAILERAVKSDDTSFVRARILGKCTARVDVTDTGHRFAAPGDGESLLKSAASGDIEILSTNKIDGTGEQELAVLLGGPGSGGKRTSLLIATDTIPAAAGGFPGDSSDFSIEDGDDPNGVIYNWSGEAIGSGAYMVTIQIGDRDVIVQAFCPMIV